MDAAFAPDLIRRHPFSHPVHDIAVPGVGSPAYRITAGSLRIWKKDGDETRDSRDIALGGDLLLPDTFYTWTQLGSGTTPLYVEAVDVSTTLGDQRIQLDFDPGDGSTYEADAVRITTASFVAAVDRNRDRTISFDSTDSTSNEKRYRFWLNDDLDRTVKISDFGGNLLTGSSEVEYDEDPMVVGISP